MNLRTSSTTVSLLLGMFCLAGSASAASPAVLSGEILGEVRSAAGIAQMGATVFLYNRYDERVRQALTNEQGRFAFDSLIPEIYSIRVVLASFVPAERRNIAVAPSSENRLEISLASVLSTVTLASPTSLRGTLMTDDWKWVLRSSQSTRPVLRLLPDSGRSSASTPQVAAFSHTTGVVKLSAGESLTWGSQQDLGTAFAIATSLSGAGSVQLSGNIGYATNAALPGAGFRTSYSRPGLDGSSPEVVLTMRQVYLGSRSGSGMIVGTDTAPPLRTASLAFLDKIDIADDLQLDYGFDFQSVSYLDRLNYLSPFVRATYDLGPQGRVRIAFSSGAHPAELLARDNQQPGSFDQDFAALATMPRISRSDSRVVVERTQNFEAGYQRVAGSRTYAMSAYRETVSNAAFMLSAPADFLPAADLLPDLHSSSSIFNVGSYQRTGYTASATQALGEHLQVSLAAGRTGALVGNAAASSYADGRDLRAGIHQAQRGWVTMRVSGTLPHAGTHLTTDYGWTDLAALMPAHVYLTQSSSQDIGLNVYVRQPLPVMSGMPWRLEATAELRNMLAQGYLPLGATGARTILTSSPRAVRGGLNFIF